MDALTHMRVATRGVGSLVVALSLACGSRPSADDSDADETASETAVEDPCQVGEAPDEAPALELLAELERPNAEIIYAMDVGADGSVVVIGRDYIGTGADATHTNFATKLDPTGAELWNHTWEPLAPEPSFVVESAAVDDEGTIYVVGRAWTGFDGHTHGGYEDIVVATLTSSGQPGWSRQWGGPGQDRGLDVAVGPDGAIYLVGILEPNDTVYGRIFVRRLSPDGEIAWTTQWGGSSFDVAHAVAVSCTGSLRVAGRDQGQGFLAKLDDQGEIEWTVRPDLDRDSEFSDVALVGDVSFVLGAEYIPTDGGNSLAGLVGRVSEDGEIEWLQPQFGGSILPYADGALITTANEWLTRLGPDGATIWSFNVQEEDLSSHLTAAANGPDGSVYYARNLVVVEEAEFVVTVGRLAK